ncbi:MAG: hypothetical protein KKH28_11270 [Elusimicrobia bacterium]|nr:hypothetical protein [Elusimicrobiota bacterium]
MAKKTDHQPATKGDLAAAVTGLRTELKAGLKQLDQKVNTLGIELAKTQLSVGQLGTDMMTELRSFKSELLAAFEQSVFKGRMYEQKAVTHGDILNGHEDKLLNHENRITLLETKK